MMTAETRKPSRKRREQYAFTPEDFVKVWTTSKTRTEVASRLTKIAGKEVPEGIVSARAAFYRRKGVRLKYMERESELDVTKLNTIGTTGQFEILTESA